MKVYHVSVEQDEGWFIGRVLDREGITTQGRSLDELLYMVRDAIELMWNQRGVELELFVSGKAITSFERRKKAPVRRNGKAATARAARKISAARGHRRAAVSTLA